MSEMLVTFTYFESTGKYYTETTQLMPKEDFWECVSRIQGNLRADPPGLKAWNPGFICVAEIPVLHDTLPHMFTDSTIK